MTSGCATSREFLLAHSTELATTPLPPLLPVPLSDIQAALTSILPDNKVPAPVPASTRSCWLQVKWTKVDYRIIYQIAAHVLGAHSAACIATLRKLGFPEYTSAEILFSRRKHLLDMFVY
jgi:hypothetical protein